MTKKELLILCRKYKKPHFVINGWFLLIVFSVLCLLSFITISSGHEKIVHVDNPFKKPVILYSMPHNYGFEVWQEESVCDVLVSKCENVYKVCGRK